MLLLSISPNFQKHHFVTVFSFLANFRKTCIYRIAEYYWAILSSAYEVTLLLILYASYVLMCFVD
jgi:hypothetical protein